MLTKRHFGRFDRLLLARLMVSIGVAGVPLGCSQSDDTRGPVAPKPGATSPAPAGATQAPSATTKADAKAAEKSPATAKSDSVRPSVTVTGSGETASGSPAEKELVFADFRVKLRLVEGNHTKNPREVIQPYYIATEPLPNEALRRCVDLAGCTSPAASEDQDAKPMQRVSVNDAKLIMKMLKARLPTHAEWINAHHAGVIKRLDCELTQFNSISIVEEHGADGVFETPLSDEIRFTYSPEHDTPHACGMRIALDAEIASKAD